jgi:hypothetical protein
VGGGGGEVTVFPKNLLLIIIAVSMTFKLEIQFLFSPLKVTLRS